MSYQRGPTARGWRRIASVLANPRISISEVRSSLLPNKRRVSEMRMTSEQPIVGSPAIGFRGWHIFPQSTLPPVIHELSRLRTTGVQPIHRSNFKYDCK